MKFYCIFSKHDASSRLLELSCQKISLPFIQITPENFDFSHRLEFKQGDILYRVSTRREARDVEKFLMNNKVTTFYKSFESAKFLYNNVLIYQKKGIPAPKTIYRLTRDKRLLKKYAGYLGGFPIIVKLIGSSHGIGVMRIDSLPSLYSVADFLLAKRKNDTFVMKEYIDANSSARLIVLGGKVIDSIEYTAPKGDFRSNEGKAPKARIKKFPKSLEKTAIAAVKALDLEFGGVDILVDKKGKHYVAEVNLPCFFPRAQMLTGTDISGRMLDFLIKKARK